MMYPNIFHDDRSLAVVVEETRDILNTEVKLAFVESGIDEATAANKASEFAEHFLEKIPDLLDQLNMDIKAIYDGDPAAKSYKEIILCYPGYFAIFSHRVAHFFYDWKVPMISRMISEFAHQRTGVDIHPGAYIGDYFCIDHGTGIVIGETAVIGNHVKIYQGVTIGAKSFKKDENGNPVKGGKRHPNIGNNVVIYANATVLGGDTTIGDGSVIGSSTWIIDSTDPGSHIYK